MRVFLKILSKRQAFATNVIGHVFIVLFQGMIITSCMKDQTEPTPSIWINRKAAILGDTIIFRDSSKNSTGRKWYLPDSTFSEQAEVVFSTENASIGNHYVNLLSYGDRPLSFASQKKSIQFYSKSWLIIDYGSWSDTIVFREVWGGPFSYGGTVSNGGLRKNLRGNNKSSFSFSLFRDYSSPGPIFSIVSYGLQPTETFPEIIGMDSISFRGVFKNDDSGILGVINPTNSGIVKWQGGRFEFENISAQYVSISSNQAGDTIPVILKGIIYAGSFDYIP